MKKEVTRYLIEEELFNGNKIWFGKNKQIIEANNPSNGWEVKEYGYKTERDAMRGLQSLKMRDENEGQYGIKYSITPPLKIYFDKDYAEPNLDYKEVEDDEMERD